MHKAVLEVGQGGLERLVALAKVEAAVGHVVHPAQDVLQQDEPRREALEARILADHPGLDGGGAAQVEVGGSQAVAEMQAEEDAAELRVAALEQALHERHGPVGGEDVGWTLGLRLAAFPAEQAVEVGLRARVCGKDRLSAVLLGLGAQSAQVVQQGDAGGRALGGVGAVTLRQVDDPRGPGSLGVAGERLLGLQHVGQVEAADAKRLDQAARVELRSGFGDHGLVAAKRRAGGDGRAAREAHAHEAAGPSALVQHGDPQAAVDAERGGALLRPLDGLGPVRRQERRVPGAVHALQRAPLRGHLGRHELRSQDVDFQRRTSRGCDACSARLTREG